MKGIRIDDGDTNRRRALPLGYALSISFALLQLAASWLLAASTADSPRQVARDAVPDGAVILFRHAIAPGGGDPAGFRLGDCATQRNLDTQGREQARRIGEQLRWKGVPVTAVWASQWCRTKETAALAFPRLKLVEQPAFNSFFDDRSKADGQTAQARALLQGWNGLEQNDRRNPDRRRSIQMNGAEKKSSSHDFFPPLLRDIIVQRSDRPTRPATWRLRFHRPGPR
jgi:broad specificity phosphatase PhoE